MTYDLLALQLDPNRLNGEGGGSEAGEERGSEAERTKQERKGGGSEAGQSKEERVGLSNEARHSCRRVPAWLENDASLVENIKYI